jgi:membrane associated rhomboid family serine protease
MIPLRDINPTRRFAFITYGLIAVNIAVFLLTDVTDTAFALIPNEISQGQRLGTLISAMFLHANLIHLGGNMLFLWIFGNNVEDRLGHVLYLFFYLLAGIAGSLLQVLVDPTSTIPSVGASGAISGVLGAYLLWFPTARVVSLVFLGIFITLLRLPAWIFIGYWAGLQVLLGLVGLAAASPGGQSGGVAYFAHIGGFLTGLAVGLLFLRRGRAGGYPA